MGWINKIQTDSARWWEMYILDDHYSVGNAAIFRTNNSTTDLDTVIISILSNASDFSNTTISSSTEAFSNGVAGFFLCS